MVRKVCVTASEPSLDASIDPRFGRSLYLLIVDVDSMKILEAIANPAVESPSGAGIVVFEVANRQAFRAMHHLVV